MSFGDSILVNYSYLADGSKASSLKASGEGLVYRGPFTYRRLANGSLSLESVVCPEGRLTPDKALLYVTDHLGSIRAVIDGNTSGQLSMDIAVGAASGAISSGAQHAFFSDAESKILSTEHRDAIWNQTKKSYRASGKSCSYQSISKSINEQIVGEASAAQCTETTVCTAIGECSGQLTSVAIDEEY